MEPHVEYRISRVNEGFLVLFAALSDGTQAIGKFLTITILFAALGEGIGWMIAIGAVPMLNVVFWSKGLFTGAHAERRLITAIITIFLEGLPILNIFPMLTISTIYTIAQSRAEDREKAKQNATIQTKRVGFRQRGGGVQGRMQGSMQRRAVRKVLSRIPHPAARLALAADMAREKKGGARRPRPADKPPFRNAV